MHKTHHLKETIPSSSITWSEMGKQNIQVKKVYSKDTLNELKASVDTGVALHSFCDWGMESHF